MPGHLSFTSSSPSLYPPTLLFSFFLLQLIQEIFKQLCHAFLIFPQFNFGNGLLQLARMDIEVQILSGYGIDAYKNPFSVDALGWMFISSFIQGLVFFTLRLLLNKSLVRKIRWGKQRVKGENKCFSCPCAHQTFPDGLITGERKKKTKLKLHIYRII